MTQMPQVNSGETSEEALTLRYREAPIGEVVASEAALLALKKTRPWALLCAIAMFVYALLGGGMLHAGRRIDDGRTEHGGRTQL